MKKQSSSKSQIHKILQTTEVYQYQFINLQLLHSINMNSTVDWICKEFHKQKSCNSHYYFEYWSKGMRKYLYI